MINVFRLIKNDYIFNITNKVYTVLISVFTSAFIVRYLGVELRGNFAYITQVTLLFSLFLNFGFYQSYAHNYKKIPKMLLQKYANIFFLQFLIFAMICAIVLLFVGNSTVMYICVLIPSAVMRVQIENVMLVENVRLKIKIHMLNRFLTLWCYMILFFAFPRNIIFPVVLILIIDVTTISAYFIFSKVRPNPIKIDFDFLKSISSFGFLPMFSSVLVTLNYSMAIIFLKHFGTTVDLGLYSVAAGVVAHAWLIPDAFKDILLSRVSRSDSIKSVALAAKLSLITVLFSALGFAVLGKFLIMILYGPEFSDSFQIIMILFVGVLSMCFFKIFNIVLIAEGRQKFFFLSLLVCVLINSLMSYLMIPVWGMYGAAAASVTSYTICGLAFLIYFSKIKQTKISYFIIFSTDELRYLMTAIAKLIFGDSRYHKMTSP